MFTPFRPEDPDLTAAIASAYDDLKSYDSYDKEYAQTVDQLTKLNALKRKSIDPDKILLVAGNLIIGFAVLKYEGTGVVTSKIWSFFSKI